ncbi:leucine-rich repeat domain-containing protein [Thiorhodovibrio frisius]|uniref:Leucine Rich Repeat (LRR)-containing protein n=1 Tax=Thiorhodovibrio frisius TaxID=631362 RepID=H8YYB3_9GAMM|nr:leucine-rich repeat domain-containing protein [Thiorhodovibrio frisius]EIC23439.1 hypothetical protein Thi970DRAFT_01104 [Thiorhodovibrio frisius]WPL23480.1 Receptor L domain protein [Thiorhodovibrio frisius]
MPINTKADGKAPLLELIEKNSNEYCIEPTKKDAYDRIVTYGCWRFFFALRGQYAPLDVTDTAGRGIPDYVARILLKFETARILLTESFNLRDPLQEGFFHRQGAKFIDIAIDDIPKKYGIASGIVRDDVHEVLEGTVYQGKSLRIVVHRNLISKTATPIHELFHLFQYGYAHFNNPWFMEGLARWAQSIVQDGTGQTEELPQDIEALDVLLNRKHDAEFFWNRLVELCDPQPAFDIPEVLAESSELPNNNKCGARYVRLLLEACEGACKKMEQQLWRKDMVASHYWSREATRSPTNNQFIFAAILASAQQSVTQPSRALENFLALIRVQAYAREMAYTAWNVQAFLRVLQRLDASLVKETNGVLHSSYFDPITGTLSVKALRVSGIKKDDVRHFGVLRRFIGELRLESCPELVTLSGFENLELIEGGIIFSRLDIASLKGFNCLRTVGRLEISNLPQLKHVSGLNQLENAGTALQLLNLPTLSTVSGFGMLAAAESIEIHNTALTKADFLRTLFGNNQDFGGAVKITRNHLTNVTFMQGVRCVASSLFLHQNRLDQLDGLQALTQVGGSLSLSANRLSSLKELSSLERVGGVLALSYNRLTTLQGLENLRSLKTKQWGDQYFTIKLYGNSELNDISALKNVLTDGHYLVMQCDAHLQYRFKPSPDSDFHRNILELRDFKNHSVLPTFQFVKKPSHDYTLFGRSTHNKLLTSLFDFEIADAKILVLSFSGAYGNLGGLFYNKFPLLIETVDTHKIFIMDPENSWYHKGIRPFTCDMESNIHFLRSLITSKPYKKVICMGTSMGAYMSLLLGCLLEGLVHEVLAFSPQVFLDETNRKHHREQRWHTLMRQLPHGINPEFLDLGRLFEHHQNNSTRFIIHYSSALPPDNAHVQRLPKQSNIRLVPYNEPDHYITVMLHKQNRLNPIILESLIGDGNSAK